MNPFSFDSRVVSCLHCGAPLAAPADGYRGRRHVVTCHHCRGATSVGERRHEEDLRRAAVPPPFSEAERFERLRSQDGRPLLPPPSLQHLLGHRGQLAPHQLSAAFAEWQRARHELMHGYAFPAAERLHVLTFAISGHLASIHQDLHVRAVLETALDHLEDQRHRQVFLGMLARHAARTGDLASAERWLELCAPHSDDLHADTAYRLSRAYLCSAAGDHATALQLLGRRAEDVPIADTSDHLAAVVRADALERSGAFTEAVAELSRWMRTPEEATVIQHIRAYHAALSLCPQSYDVVLQRQANPVVTRSDARMSVVSAVAFVGIPLVSAIAFIPAMFGYDAGPLVVIAVLMEIVAIALAVGHWSRAKRERQAHLERHGIRGVALVLAVEETGTRINDNPVLKLMLQITAGAMSFQAHHEEIVPPLLLSRVVPGSSIPILVDPQRPNVVALQWG